jgi:hypothetical protein
VLIEITVVSVVITFVRAKVKMRVEITLDRVVITLVSVTFTRMCVKKNSRVCGNHTLRVKSHSTYGNRTLRVEINLMRVEFTLSCVLILHSACRNYTVCV